MKNMRSKTTLTTLTTILLCAILLQGCSSMIAPLAGNIISRTTGLHHSAEDEPEHAGLARKESEQAIEQAPKPALEIKPKQTLEGKKLLDEKTPKFNE